MREPTLVVMAAGMGSRFGGLKQVEPVDDCGNAIISFSLFDAKKAGFKKVAFIIKKEIEDDFKNAIGKKAQEQFEVSYVFQEVTCLPDGYALPEGRQKPWGTGHAVLCCLGTVKGPFAVINADDFYSRSAFEEIYKFLSEDRAETEHAMVGYHLSATLTESGHVSRGICETENGLLRSITERTHIEKRGDAAAYTEDGENFFPLTGEETVSMNFWGFGETMLRELEARFPAFLDENLPKNPLKCEFYLPQAVGEVICEGLGTVRVLNCDAQWHGVTYRDDLDRVKKATADLKREGVYPESF